MKTQKKGPSKTIGPKSREETPKKGIGVIRQLPNETYMKIELIRSASQLIQRVKALDLACV